ncbi:hypothetical protein HYALB_00002299 [Hymenoscyphus albidus]|uniref:Uncharacterized protein n=1 Tax=Hymenoscyphus albidus TaxID=595503 RepID=A0A9N9LWQ5_9HELO|nr:hypothetical protein HYALB_00002299 [Hymenoscyphus albidus]
MSVVEGTQTRELTADRWYIQTPADHECAETRGTVEPASNSRPAIGSGNDREKNRIAGKGTNATRRWIFGRSQHDCRQLQAAGNGFPAIGIDNIAPQGPVPTVEVPHFPRKRTINDETGFGSAKLDRRNVALQNNSNCDVFWCFMNPSSLPAILTRQ